MKTLCYFLVMLVLPRFLMAEETDSLTSTSGRKPYLSTPVFLPVVFDPDLSMRSGAENVLSLHRWLTQVEDRGLSTRWFSEKTILGKSGGIAGRFAKLVLLDLPVDYFSVVFVHEYFGHGARYRELNIGNIDYGYDLPPPYGAGGGACVYKHHKFD